jgi:hypothetical protein
MGKHYTILDLPPVPDKYIKVALEMSAEFSALPNEERAKRRTNPFHNPVQRSLKMIRNGQSMSGRTAPRVDFVEIFKDWVNENISQEWNQIDVGVNLPPPNGDYSTAVVAHTDTTRSYVLIYLLDTSNDDQETAFFHEQGYPLHRKRNTTIEDYSQMVEIERARFPLHTWAFLDATVIHAVENVQGYRTAIHVGFDCDPFGVFTKE